MVFHAPRTVSCPRKQPRTAVQPAESRRCRAPAPHLTPIWSTLAARWLRRTSRSTSARWLTRLLRSLPSRWIGSPRFCEAAAGDHVRTAPGFLRAPRAVVWRRLPHCNRHTGPRAGPAGRRCQRRAMSAPFVPVPRELLRSEASAFDVAVWCVLVAHRNRSTGEAFPSRARVMERLGRAGTDPRQVSRATERLRRSERLSKRQEYIRGKWRTHYGLPAATAYVELPQVVLDQLAGDQGQRLTPELLRSLLRWMDLCGGSGWTRDSLSRYAATFPGACVRTAKAHRSALVRQGLLRVETQSGRPTETRLSWVSTTGAESRTATSRKGREPGQNPAPYRGNIPHRTGAESRTPPGQNHAQGTSSRVTNSLEQAPEDLTPSISPASLTEARAAGPGGETRDSVAVVTVAQRIGCAEPLARRIVDELRVRFRLRNVAAYVQGMPAEDLRHWEHEVLARGNPAPWDVPGARAPRAERPEWCGECDDRTRLVETTDDRVQRCPACHPEEVLPAWAG